MSKKPGCKPPWDTLSSKSIPICDYKTIDFETYRKPRWQLLQLEQKYIIQETGCFPPCTYREYQAVGAPLKIKQQDENITEFQLGFYFGSTDLKTEKEIHVYPLMSFISELGGSLGLFVGFSFIAIFDYLEFILIMFKSLKYSKDS